MALIELDYYSEALSNSVHLEVILPCNDGWPQASAPFQTLYFIPGSGYGSKEIVSTMSFRLQSMLKGIAVVVADGEKSCDKDYYEKYLDFFGREIVEVTREIFPLSHKKEDTFIGGIGTGAIYAFRNSSKNNNDKFSKTILVSPGKELCDSEFKEKDLSVYYCCQDNDDLILWEKQLDDAFCFLKENTFE